MHHKLNDLEREVVRIVNHFKKMAERLILQGKLGEEHKEVLHACERLVNKIREHVAYRENVGLQRENLKKLLKDNASCPECQHKSHLKFIKSNKNKDGYSVNRYKCRRCNIEFNWNTPNNPWDLLKYMQGMKKDLEEKLQTENSEEALLEGSRAISQIDNTYAQLAPVVEASDEASKELEEVEKQMNKGLKEFKTYLLFEKLKLETLEE